MDSHKEGRESAKLYVVRSIFLCLSLADFDEGFVFKPSLLVSSIENVFEILEIGKTLQNNFDRYARTLTARYHSLNLESDIHAEGALHHW